MATGRDWERQCLYDVLGVTPQATQDEIKQAYRAKAKAYHPDLNKAAHAAEHFKRVSNAHDTLSCPNKRATYDGRRTMRMHYGTGGGGAQAWARGGGGAYSGPYGGGGGRAGGGYGAYARHARGGGGSSFNVLDVLFHPRLLWGLLPLAVIGGLAVGAAGGGGRADDRAGGVGDKVLAWWNPRTRRWETPAPWDPDYRARAATHPEQLVARHKVHATSPP